MSQAAIEVRGLTKLFASQHTTTPALDGVDFSVASGELFGLIGADGSGKTTAFRILSGVLAPTAGAVRIFGQAPVESRQHTGYVTQPFTLYRDLTILENLEYIGGLKKLSRSTFEAGRRHYIGLFGLAPFEHRLAGRLSGGMQQKLALCCALIAQPRVLLLDEPTTGIDPVTRREVWDVLLRLTRGGITVVIASPYFDDAEQCDRIAHMDQGRILAIDQPAILRARLGLTRLVVHGGGLAAAEAVLTANSFPDTGISDVQRFGDRLDVITAEPGAAEPAVRRAFLDAGLEEPEVRRATPTLENAFVATLRALRGRESVPEFPGRSGQDAAVRRHSGPAIVASGLGKRFGTFEAVRDFSLDIRYGEIVGLVGANGAGKTTAIKMLCGLLAPSAGDVELMGRSTGLRSPDIRSRIGYMSQKFTLYDDLSIGENLDLYARLYGLPDGLRRDRAEWVLEIAGLTGNQSLRTGLLAGGWKQRVAFGAAIMHEPEVLFLDEPTSGVDPLARRVMWRIIRQLADRGTAVLVVTHYPQEAEQCNRLGFMLDGDVVARGSPRDLKDRLGTGCSLEDVFISLIEQRRQGAAPRHA